MLPRPRSLIALWLSLLAGTATAQELSWSGFATVGFAQSDRGFTYQRQIRDEGGFGRDSLLGVQADLRLSPQWSATAQLKLQPSLKHDRRWDVTTSWAFLAWRPGDNWLLRAGRLRLPMYLQSEAMDVGQTHDMARLPAELYTIVPTPDFDGAWVSRNWALGDNGQRELTADLYTGGARSSARFSRRDGAPPLVPAGPSFLPVKISASGLALSLREPGLLVRSSLSRTAVQRRDGRPIPVSYPFVPVAPGLGYYQVSDLLPGPGVTSVGKVHNTIFSLGAEIGLGQGWRITSEFVRNLQHDTHFGADASAGYVAVFKQIGASTPYLSLARQASRQSTFDWYQRLTGHPLPAALPGADLINAAQRVAAESYWVTSQQSLALGAAYALSPQLKLKGEWLHSRIGPVSRMVDTPAGQPTPHDTAVNVLSVNLNFVF